MRFTKSSTGVRRHTIDLGWGSSFGLGSRTSFMDDLDGHHILMNGMDDKSKQATLSSISTKSLKKIMLSGQMLISSVA